MSERYVKVFGCDENLYSENAPVIIRAGALLKDTESGRMIAQLKLQNVSGKIISYVKASITMLDATRNQIGDLFGTEYLDLSATDLEIFGAKNAIILPSPSVRAFQIGIKSVAFADGTVWSGEDMNWTHVDDTAPVMVRIKTEEIYNKAFTLSQEKNEADIKKAIELFKSIEANKSVSADIERCNQKLDELAADADKAKKKKKKAKIIWIAIGGLILAVALFFLVLHVIVPRAVYAHAQTLIDEGKYEEAVEEAFDTFYNASLGEGGMYRRFHMVYNNAIRACIENGEVERAYELHREYIDCFYYYDYIEFEKITDEQKIQKLQQGVDDVLNRLDFADIETIEKNCQFMNYVLLSFESSEYNDIRSLISNYLRYDKVDSKYFTDFVWQYKFVRKYATENIKEFLAGRWETADGAMYFSLNASTARINYNLPVPNKTGVDHYVIEDLLLFFEASNDNKVCDVFKFELNDTDPNVIKIYCYEDNNTYTLYRQK